MTHGHEPHEEIAVPFRAAASESMTGPFEIASDILVLFAVAREGRPLFSD